MIWLGHVEDDHEASRVSVLFVASDLKKNAAAASYQSLALHSVDHRRMGASQEEETEWERKKEATERGREVCGREERSDVISIDSQAEHTYAGRCGCYHWGDRKEVGGLFALNFNSIGRKASRSDLRGIQSRKITTFF